MFQFNAFLVGHRRDAELKPIRTPEHRRDDGKFHQLNQLRSKNLASGSQTVTRNRWAMGMRRPMPNARGDTFSPGAAWRRLYSLKVILLMTSLTTAASNPRSVISDLLKSCTTYASRIRSRMS